MVRGSQPWSDLVQDSHLPTTFLNGHTRHTSHVSGHHRRNVRVEDTWQRQGELGNGTYGRVFLETCVEGVKAGQVRAVKEMRKDTPPSSTATNYLRELEAVAKFSHERYAHCFVKSSGWFETDTHVYIAMEYINNGDLQKCMSRAFPEIEVQEVASQLIEGLAFMHENGFAHRDLKPANILVFRPGPNWWIKIGDFGISKRVGGGTALRTMIGTEAYLAPEVLGFVDLPPESFSEDGHVEYTFAVDMWALGEICFRLLVAEPVFPARQALRHYCNGQLHFPREHLREGKVTDDGCDFVAALMAVNPEARLTTKNGSSHPWLEKELQPSGILGSVTGPEKGKEKAQQASAMLPSSPGPLSTIASHDHVLHELATPIPEASLPWTTMSQDLADLHLEPSLVSHPGTGVASPRLQIGNMQDGSEPTPLDQKVGQAQDKVIPNRSPTSASTSSFRRVHQIILPGKASSSGPTFTADGSWMLVRSESKNGLTTSSFETSTWTRGSIFPGSGPRFSLGGAFKITKNSSKTAYYLASPSTSLIDGPEDRLGALVRSSKKVLKFDSATGDFREKHQGSQPQGDSKSIFRFSARDQHLLESCPGFFNVWHLHSIRNVPVEKPCTLKPDATVFGEKWTSLSASFHPDGHHVIFNDECGLLWKWDMDAHSRATRFFKLPELYNPKRFRIHPDGRRVCFMNNSKSVVEVWDQPSNSRLFIWEPGSEGSSMCSIRFSSCGRWLAILQKYRCTILLVTPGARILDVNLVILFDETGTTGQSAAAGAWGFFPGGNRIAIATHEKRKRASMVQIWELQE